MVRGRGREEGVTRESKPRTRRPQAAGNKAGPYGVAAAAAAAGGGLERRRRRRGRRGRGRGRG